MKKKLYPAIVLTAAAAAAASQRPRGQGAGGSFRKKPPLSGPYAKRKEAERKRQLAAHRHANAAWEREREKNTRVYAVSWTEHVAVTAPTEAARVVLLERYLSFAPHEEDLRDEAFGDTARSRGYTQGAVQRQPNKFD